MDKDRQDLLARMEIENVSEMLAAVKTIPVILQHKLASKRHNFNQ